MYAYKYVHIYIILHIYLYIVYINMYMYILCCVTGRLPFFLKLDLLHVTSDLNKALRRLVRW